MIRTTSTFRVPILWFVGTFLTLAALAGLPTGAWAEFRIGVWLFWVADRARVELYPLRCECKTSGRQWRTV